MTDQVTSASNPPSPGMSAPDAQPFASLDELRAQHQALLERQAGDDTTPPQEIPPDTASAFVARAKATGTILSDPEDRQVAQRAIDYWSADLVVHSRARRVEVDRVQLAPYLTPAAPDRDAPRARGAPASPDSPFQRPEDAREYIRLSALARQWRDSGANPFSGYLLSGDALDDAERFARDPDIAALLGASRKKQVGAQRRRQRYMYALIAALITVIAGLSVLLVTLELARRAASEANDEAVAQTKVAENNAAAAIAALEESRRLRSELEATVAAANQNIADLQPGVSALEEALELLSGDVIAGRLDLDRIRSDFLRNRLLLRVGPNFTTDQLQGRLAIPDASGSPVSGTASGSEPSAAAFGGYDPNFTGLDLPMPSLSEDQAGSAWQGGAPIGYHNFGVVLDTARRLPRVAAANLDRIRSRTLLRAEERFRHDPRLPLADQPDPQSFAAEGMDTGQLVDRGDISWGEAMPEDNVAAAEFVSQVTRLYPNLVPMPAGLRDGAWAAVGNWVRLQHNPGAARVTILAGPVFGEAGEMPQAYWKIAVSAAPGTMDSPYDAGVGPVVDAFLIPADAAPLAYSAFDDPAGVDAFRVRVDEIAARTGLRFPPVLREPALATQAITALVASLQDSDPGELAVVRDQLSDLLQDPSAGAAADQRVLVETMLGRADQGPAADLAPTWRASLLDLLSQVPAAAWDREGWLALKARARRFAAGLPADLDPAAAGDLAALRSHLGLDRPPGQTVYLQFSGYTRERAKMIADGLRALGWQLPGEERVAPAVNQVRYAPSRPEDAAAARLLAADLQAAGLTSVEPVAVGVIKPGVLEVWVSPPPSVEPQVMFPLPSRY